MSCYCILNEELRTKTTLSISSPLSYDMILEGYKFAYIISAKKMFSKENADDSVPKQRKKTVNIIKSGENPTS